jgi:hypothetical protein
MHIGFWKQNVGDKKQVLHMGFEIKHGFQNNSKVSIRKEEVGFQGTC